jgi:hypothetical protein
MGGGVVEDEGKDSRRRHEEKGFTAKARRTRRERIGGEDAMEIR